jgi:hypothetical protein
MRGAGLEQVRTKDGPFGAASFGRRTNDLTLEREAGGPWKVTEASGTTWSDGIDCRVKGADCS